MKISNVKTYIDHFDVAAAVHEEGRDIVVVLLVCLLCVRDPSGVLHSME